MSPAPGARPAPESAPEARPGVLLDRDGTLIDFVRDPDLGAVVPAFHPAQIRFLPGVIEGLRLLADRGFVLAIATNQPGAAKGQIPLAAITRTNDALLERLRAEGIPIASLAVCLHHPDGGPGGDATLVRACDCRKPKPGMLRALLRDLHLDPSRSFMIGDAMTDVEAGRAAGVRTALLAEIGRCEMCPMKEASAERALPPTALDGAPESGELASQEGARLLRTARRAPSSYGAPEPGTSPDLVAARFDSIARAIVAALTVGPSLGDKNP